MNQTNLGSVTEVEILTTGMEAPQLIDWSFLKETFNSNSHLNIMKKKWGGVYPSPNLEGTSVPGGVPGTRERT